ncbi:hypothetical protein FS842_002644 [Serendipita sp. 407]|nr:hypothetical protein FS842_002644 [Serendipita sp. 407]
MASPFQKPVGALRSRLLAELSTVEQSRQAVDDLIFSAEAHLASLIEERYIISREIEGRKANLSPINYVPFEVLGNIFIQVNGVQHLITFEIAPMTDSPPKDIKVSVYYQGATYFACSSSVADGGTL